MVFRRHKVNQRRLITCADGPFPVILCSKTKTIRSLVHILLFLLLGHSVQAQSNFRNRLVINSGDTLTIDTLSMVPGSIQVFYKGNYLDTSLFRIEPLKGTMHLDIPKGDTVRILYRVFPQNFHTEFAHKKSGNREPDIQQERNSFRFQPGKATDDLFGGDGLNKSGSISRGVNFGNNQDLSVNSSLNLQLNGKISDRLSLMASVTDDNIPIQPDGNTQQLQDFDQVFIKVYDENSSLTAGDFWMKKPLGHFMVYNKRAQGASFSTLQNNTEKGQSFETRTSAALSKGKFARNLIPGREGNQGPYRLRGAENETFIIVLAGTEQVYIDGQLLKRGQENDYIIDYNTAEITFTPNRLITKDRRIVVEFQYSDKNYARSIFESTNTWKIRNTGVYLNIYSEQDSKNQPLQQNLSDSAKSLLASVGDSVYLAVFPSQDSVGYDPNRVLYRKTDSLGYDPVFVFSSHPDSAVYAVRFSFVGEGRGDYVQSNFTAIGRTFRWVAPDTVASQIVRRGNFAPVEILIAPKKRQMISTGIDHRFGKKGRFRTELAVSKIDQNTFSSLHKSDDQGFGIKLAYENDHPVFPQKKDLSLYTKADVEMVDAQFRSIERYRSVEFERNWNVLNRTLQSSQLLADIEIGIRNKQERLGYGFQSFLSGKEYSGMLHRINGDLRRKKWSGYFNGSYLDAKGNGSSNFMRHKSQIARNIGKFSFGYRDEHELNRFYTASDSLRTGSYQFHEWEAFFETADTARNRIHFAYRERIDKLYDTTKLGKAAHARQYTAGFTLASNASHRLRAHAGYRELQIVNPLLTSQAPERTLVNRIEYDLRAWKGAVTANTFFEVGTGQELRKEFIYLEVPAGQGIYAWVDYNGNGIKDLSEFEIAAFPDQARFIRSFTPTNEYVKTYTNQFSQSLLLNPAAVWRSKKGWKKALTYFSNQTAYRVDRKTNSENETDRFNPFLREIADTSLLSLNSSFRNTIFINRTGAVFGLDHTYQDLRSKSLLTNGFDSRIQRSHLVKLRWNITPEYSIIIEGERGEKGSTSDFLSSRNFIIGYDKINPRLNFQPNTRLRITASYKYSNKQNKPEYGNESAELHDIGAELRYNVVNKGSLLINMNHIRIRYVGANGTPIAFDMLEALQPGMNYTWSSSWQQNLSKNMQLSLSYNGRKSETSKIIHTGGVQVRAFF